MDIPQGAYGFIYLTTNKINRKKYIGQKKIDDIGAWKHYLGSGKAFKLSVKKYGKENFERKILKFAYSPEELNSLEIAYIKKLNCMESKEYYNIVAGGGTVTGLKFNEATLKRFSELATGEKNYFYGKRFFGEENKFYGKHHTLQSREKMSKSHKGQSPWNKGRIDIYTEEQLQRMRESKLGKKISEEHRQAIIQNTPRGGNHPFYGKHLSKEAKAKIGEANKGNHMSDLNKKAMSERTKKRHKENPESFNKKSKKVRCIENGKIFESAEEARKWVGLSNPSGIYFACTGRKQSAGKINGKKVHWEYVE